MLTVGAIAVSNQKLQLVTDATHLAWIDVLATDLWHLGSNQTRLDQNSILSLNLITLSTNDI